MCEFNVFLNEKKVFENATYAKAMGSRVLLRDVLGSSMELENCRIVEVDVRTERLVLAKS